MGQRHDLLHKVNEWLDDNSYDMYIKYRENGQGQKMPYTRYLKEMSSEGNKLVNKIHRKIRLKHVLEIKDRNRPGLDY